MHTEQSLFRLLQERYTSDSWVLLPQVPDGTGMQKRRTADAVAMSLWPSRGLEIHGFEMKVSRADWLSELKNPQKAESIAQYCDRWWVVTSDKAVAKISELPLTWGLLTVGKKGLRVAKQAEIQEAFRLDRKFLAAMLRAANKHADTQIAEGTNRRQREQELFKRYQEGIAEGKRLEKHVSGYNSRELTALQETVRDFEQASGIRISGWKHQARQLGEEVAAVRDFKASPAKLAHIQADLSRLAEQVGLLSEAVSTANAEKSKTRVRKRLKPRGSSPACDH